MGQQQGTMQQLVIAKPGIIIPKTIKQSMTDEMLGYVHLGSGKWKNVQVGNYAPYINEWRIKKGLTLDANHQPLILYQISNIKFQFMLEMSLRQNNIQSIQILPWIYMPNIEKLYFCSNNISSIKPLRKFHAPNLTYLSFNGNQALQTSIFSYLQSQILEEFFIHLKKDTLISLNYIAKIKSKMLTKIWFGKYYQNKQQNCFKSIRKKYKNFIMNEFQIPTNCER